MIQKPQWLSGIAAFGFKYLGQKMQGHQIELSGCDLIARIVLPWQAG